MSIKIVGYKGQIIELPDFLRLDDCKHPTITDEQMYAHDCEMERTWGNADEIICPDCNTPLWLKDTDEIIASDDRPGSGGDWPYVEGPPPSPYEKPKIW